MKLKLTLLSFRKVIELMDKLAISVDEITHTLDVATKWSHELNNVLPKVIDKAEEFIDDMAPVRKMREAEVDEKGKEVIIDE